MNNPCESCERECQDPGCALYIGPQPKVREVFSYEHPDRVREMAAEKEAKNEA